MIFSRHFEKKKKFLQKFFSEKVSATKVSVCVCVFFFFSEKVSAKSSFMGFTVIFGF